MCPPLLNAEAAKKRGLHCIYCASVSGRFTVFGWFGEVGSVGFVVSIDAIDGTFALSLLSWILIV